MEVVPFASLPRKPTLTPSAYLVAVESPYQAAWRDVYAQVEAYAAGRRAGKAADRRTDEEAFADAYAYAVEHGRSEADASAYASKYVEHSNCECVTAEWAHEHAAAHMRAADIDSEYAFAYVEGAMHGVAASDAKEELYSALVGAYVDAMLEAEERRYAHAYIVDDYYAETYAEAAIWGMQSPGQARDLADAYALDYARELEQIDSQDWTDAALAEARVRERGLGYLPEAKRAFARIYIDAHARALEQGLDWDESSSDNALFYANAYADAIGRGFSAERARSDADAYETARKAALDREKPGSWPILYAEGYVRGINWPAEAGFEPSPALARAYAEGYADGHSGALSPQE